MGWFGGYCGNVRGVGLVGGIRHKSNPILVWNLITTSVLSLIIAIHMGSRDHGLNRIRGWGGVGWFFDGR